MQEAFGYRVDSHLIGLLIIYFKVRSPCESIQILQHFDHAVKGVIVGIVVYNRSDFQTVPIVCLCFGLYLVSPKSRTVMATVCSPASYHW